MFFRELLHPLGLQDLIDSKQLAIDESTLPELKQRLSRISFSTFVSFVGSLEIIFKQLGNLLDCNNYLLKLANVLVLVLSISKKFLGHLKVGDYKDQPEEAVVEHT